MILPKGEIKPKGMFLQVHITSRCNLSCKHCYAESICADMQPDLFREVQRQFRELVDTLKVLDSWVQITGGEPTVHPQFLDLLDISATSFPTRILTNGTLIDDQLASRLAERCEEVQISFDGTKEIHDSWRGNGSYDAAFSGLLRLKSAGVRRSVRMTVGKDNVEAVEELFNELEPHIDRFNLSRVVPIGACGVGLPDASDYRMIIHRLYARHFSDKKINLKDPFFGVLMGVDYADEEFYGCSAGISGLCVTETGDIYPCRRLPINLGNVRTESLKSVYFGHPLTKALRQRAFSGKCGNCEEKQSCGGSRCIAYALTGDPLGEDPGCIFS